MTALDFPNLSKLINDPFLNDPFGPAILVKLPSDIVKFDGKQGGDPKNHVMNFHLWCSLKSLMDDSIHLWFFQRNLTGTTAKWYIELPQHLIVYFISLETTFLTHFQLS